MRFAPSVTLAILLGVPSLALAAGDTPAAPAKDAPAKKKKKKGSSTAEPAAPVEPAPASHEPVYGPQLPDDSYGPQLPQEPSLAHDNILKPTAEPFHFGRGRILVGAKFGGLFSFGGFGASFYAGVEVGWALPKLPVIGETLALVVDLGYSQPGASGTVTDPRVDGGSYTWSVTQRELMLGINVMYRATWVKTAKLEAGRLVPYIGIGPRIFFLQSVTGGTTAKGGALPSTSEQSTRVGVGVPLGLELGLGPGRIFLEAMILWAGFEHNVTGPANLGAITVSAGYRFLL